MSSSLTPKPPPPDRSTMKDFQTMARNAYDVAHLDRPWGWKVSTYLWSKSVAAGSLLFSALAVAAGWTPTDRLAGVAAPGLTLVLPALTMALLVFDLKRADRFHYILLKPNWRSWLVWGAWIWMGFGAAAALWLVGGLMGGTALLRLLAWPAALLAAPAAGYSAFLFGQAEGRDFWQSPLLLRHLLGRKHGMRVRGVAAEALRVLQSYSWPGNVRELEKVLSRTVIMAEGEPLRSEDLGLPAVGGGSHYDGPHNTDDSSALSLRQQEALQIASPHGVVRRGDLVARFGISRESARQNLLALVRAGFLRRSGSGRRSCYIAASRM